MQKKITKYIFLATILLIPLIFNPWGFDMYEIPKNMLFKTGISVAIIFALISGLENKKNKLTITREQIYAIVFFLLILGVSMIVSLRPEISFWGSYYRQGGVINMLYYVALFVLAINIFKDKKNRELFFKLLSVVGIAISIYAILQKLGVDIFNQETTAIFERRSFATLGNPTSLGAFLLFPIWGEIYLLYKEKNKKKSIPALALMIIALVCTRNRASILALVGTGFLALLHKFRKNKKIITGIIITTVLAGAIFVGIYAQDLRSLGSRGEIWGSSLEMIIDNPTHGYGLESFSYLFEKYVHADFFRYEDYKNLVDRPHNELLETWIHLGLLGLVFYLGLIVFCLKTFWTTKEQEKYFATLAILSLFATNLFSFSLVTHYVFLIVFLAIIVEKKEKIVIKTKLWAILLIIIMAWGMILNGRIFLADSALIDGFSEVSTDKLEEAIEYAPQYLEIYKETYTIYYALGVYTDVEYLERAQEINEKALKLSVNDLKSLLDKARLYEFAGQYELAEEVYLQINANIAPNPLVYEKWGNMYYDWGLYEHAVLIYDQLLDIMPNSWEISQEGTEERRIFWKDHPDFANTLAKIGGLYELAGRTEEAQQIKNSLP